MKYIMVIAVGEEDNNGYSTEFFRVMKEIYLLVPPPIGSYIEYEAGKHFYVNEFEQAPLFGQLYLYSRIFKNRLEFDADPEEYNKVKEKYLKDGWSETKGGFQLMHRVYKKKEE